MSDLSTIYPMVVRAITAGFAVAGWVYAHKRGYSLFGKSFWVFCLLFSGF